MDELRLGKKNEPVLDIRGRTGSAGRDPCSMVDVAMIVTSPMTLPIGFRDISPNRV